ncbi:putative purine permease, plant [Rosa chinensis]|uniref:Probable purine permease n=1 Tax=Rosa chinensis TaxID=74649 RepID=A0A2P6PA71_ROSCH|nr:putative purine permease, plant [Rosa chinensis]
MRIHSKFLSNSVSLQHANHEPTIHQRRNYKLWFRIATYIFFALSGQSTATLLGRFYFEKGGKSKWVGALVQLAGFPILLPFYFFVSSKISRTPSTTVAAACPIQYSKPTSLLTTLALVYVTLGLLVAGICFLTSFGLQYLPVSTFSLICASQLGFTALFSFFLNSQKFTPFVINSIVLLTISSILLVFNTDSSSVLVSKAKYKVGFICTIGAAAGNGLALALTQFAFTKIIKKQTFRAVVDLIIYESLIATCATLVGLFASGEWKGLNLEMDEFQTGKGSYVLTLAWTMISWQVFAIGAVGLIFEVSSLFCNVIIALGLPVVQVLAVIVFHDRMHGLKIVAIVLALWGFISYVYQQYLDDHCKSFESTENENA